MINEIKETVSNNLGLADTLYYFHIIVEEVRKVADQISYRQLTDDEIRRIALELS